MFTAWSEISILQQRALVTVITTKHKPKVA